MAMVLDRRCRISASTFHVIYLLKRSVDPFPFVYNAGSKMHYRGEANGWWRLIQVIHTPPRSLTLCVVASVLTALPCSVDFEPLTREACILPTLAGQ